MSFFSKKTAEPIDLPVIPASVIGRLEVQASHLARAAFRIKDAIQSVPGLTEYASKAIVPKLAPLLLTQQFDKALALVVGDAVIGVALSAAISAMKETFSKESTNV